MWKTASALVATESGEDARRRDPVELVADHTHKDDPAQRCKIARAGTCSFLTHLHLTQ